MIWQIIKAIFGGVGGGGAISPDEEAKFQKVLDELIPDPNVSPTTKINEAAQMILRGANEQAATAYGEIARLHPEEQGTCYGQMGVAYFFLERYEDAITHYKMAIEHGESPASMQENIKEAEEALATQAA